MTIRLFLKANPREIIYINSTLDSYEGSLGLMRTEDEQSGKLTMYADESCEDALRAFIDALNSEGVDVKIVASDRIDEV